MGREKRTTISGWTRQRKSRMTKTDTQTFYMKNTNFSYFKTFMNQELQNLIDLFVSEWHTLLLLRAGKCECRTYIKKGVLKTLGFKVKDLV